MTLKYTIFGRPGNQQEFDDLVKRKNLSVDVGLGEILDDFGVGWSVDCECFPVLLAGGKRLSLRDKHRVPKLLYLNTKEGKLERLTIQERAFNQIVEIATKYLDMGYKVTIAEKSVEEAKTDVERYHSTERAKFQAA